MPAPGSTILLQMADGSAPCPLKLPPPGDRPSFWAYSVHKAGSTLLERILFDVCAATGFPAVNVPSTMVAAGSVGNPRLVSAASWLQVWRAQGYAYFGFRSAHLPPADLLAQAPVILLLRDPRDIAISLYFSIAKSHTTRGRPAEFLARRAEAASMSPDEWVRQRDWKLLRASFATYRQHLAQARCRVYRYEDVIFRKRAWIADMLDHVGLPLEPAQLDAIAKRHDILPDAERPDQHIRQVAPGNHRQHLSAETIALLERDFAEWLTVMGYEPPLAVDGPLSVSDLPGFNQRFCTT